MKSDNQSTVLAKEKVVNRTFADTAALVVLKALMYLTQVDLAVSQTAGVFYTI